MTVRLACVFPSTSRVRVFIRAFRPWRKVALRRGSGAPPWTWRVRRVGVAHDRRLADPTLTAGVWVRSPSSGELRSGRYNSPVLLTKCPADVTLSERR